MAFKRWWRTWDEMAAEFAAAREPESDDDFARNCGLNFSAEAIRIAIAVRQSVAAYGMVDRTFIKGTDRFPGELQELSGWDSVDFLAWSLELENALGEKCTLNGFDTHLDLYEPFSVRQLAQAVYEWKDSGGE